MQKTLRICDICGRTIKADAYYTINVRSPRFINYANYDSFNPDKKKIDICGSCVQDFKHFVRQKIAERSENDIT